MKRLGKNFFYLMWNWLTNWISDLPTAAAQKVQHDTQIMILNAEHKKAIEVVEAENRDLRAKVEPLTEQLEQCQGALKQCHAAVSLLQKKLGQNG